MRRVCPKKTASKNSKERVNLAKLERDFSVALSMVFIVLISIKFPCNQIVIIRDYIINTLIKIFYGKLFLIGSSTSRRSI